MIILAADHFAVAAKKEVAQWLRSRDLDFKELGSVSESDICSIADFIPLVAREVLSAADNKGIMLCGTGIGVDIGANRFRGIRSVLASTPKIAEWSRTYDNSNILCLSGWDYSGENIRAILTAWFDTPFLDTDGSKNKFLSAMDRW